MNLHEARTLAQLILDAYPQVELREKTREIYEKWLLDLDRGSTETAIDELIASSSEMPTVAQIRRIVFERRAELPTAHEAWMQVSTRGAEVHPLAKEVRELFGGSWGILTSEEPDITRAQFLKAYETARERRLRELNTANRRDRQRQPQAA